MRLNRWWILGAALSLLPVLVVADTRDDTARHRSLRWTATVHFSMCSPRMRTS
jgi:hypothetical protein